MKGTGKAPFKYIFKKHALHTDQNWFIAVVFLKGIPIYTEFPCLKIFPLHNFQTRDCPCILAHTIGIGLLLLMVGYTKERQITRLNIKLEGPRALKVPVKITRI